MQSPRLPSFRQQMSFVKGGCKNHLSIFCSDTLGFQRQRVTTQNIPKTMQQFLSEKLICLYRLIPE
jgi:hypothetical protein